MAPFNYERITSTVHFNSCPRCSAARWNWHWCVWEPPKAECLERPSEEGDWRKAVQRGSRDDHEHREHFTEAAGWSAGDAQAKDPEVDQLKREQGCRSVMTMKVPPYQNIWSKSPVMWPLCAKKTPKLNQSHITFIFCRFTNSFSCMKCKFP